MATDAWYKAIGIYGYTHQSFHQAGGSITLTIQHDG